MNLNTKGSGSPHNIAKGTTRTEYRHHKSSVADLCKRDRFIKLFYGGRGNDRSTN